MKPLKQARTILQRLVLEGNMIQAADRDHPGTLMNEKAEWGRGKMVRFQTIIQRY